MNHDAISVQLCLSAGLSDTDADALLTRLNARLSAPLAWVFEDELPEGYPYDALYPYSKVDIVRMFPVFDPQCAPPTQLGSVQLVEAITKAILNELWGETNEWREHTDLGEAAIRAYREYQAEPEAKS